MQKQIFKKTLSCSPLQQAAVFEKINFPNKPAEEVTYVAATAMCAVFPLNLVEINQITKEYLTSSGKSCSTFHVQLDPNVRNRWSPLCV